MLWLRKAAIIKIGTLSMKMSLSTLEKQSKLRIISLKKVTSSTSKVPGALKMRYPYAVEGSTPSAATTTK